jgi:hypothetical protein
MSLSEPTGIRDQKRSTIELVNEGLPLWFKSAGSYLQVGSGSYCTQRPFHLSSTSFATKVRIWFQALVSARLSGLRIWARWLPDARSDKVVL